MEINSSAGYEKLREQLEVLMEDINTMLEHNEISNTAASYLIARFGNMVYVCDDYKKFCKEENHDTQKCM